APAPVQRALAAADLPAAIPGFARYVFVDGAFAPALSAPLDATTARVTRLAAAADAARTAAVPSPRPASADERFALLNEAFATDGVEIRVAGPSAAGARLELVFVARAESEEGASYPRVELRLESGTQLTPIERHVSAGAAASFVNGAVTVGLGRGAALEHYRLQELAPRAIAFDTLSATLAEEASYRLFGIATGALSSRSTLAVQLAGVRCSHGATAGKLDDDMLFYLLSRGLPPEVAQRLLKWAFLEDVVALIGVPELRRDIEKRLALQVPELEPHTEAV